MPFQYINEMLRLPELQLHSIVSKDLKEIHLEALPVTYKQPCPLCDSEKDVKRDGRNKPRKIRHLSVFGRKCYLYVEQGERIDHDVVRNTVKTMRNWQEEIIYYHRCRWTNAKVEDVTTASKRINAGTILHAIVVATKQAF